MGNLSGDLMVNRPALYVLPPKAKVNGPSTGLQCPSPLLDQALGYLLVQPRSSTQRCQ